MIDPGHDQFVPRDRTRGTENASPQVARKDAEDEEVEFDAGGAADGAGAVVGVGGGGERKGP